MTTPATQPARLDAALQRVVESLRAYEPEQIILFGSLARGDAGEHSDIDLIVIKDTDLPRQERRSECEERLPDKLGVGVDIIVYTPAEVEGMIERRNPFLAAAFTDGVVVYDRNPIPGAPPLWSRLKEPTMESRLRNAYVWLESVQEDLQMSQAGLNSGLANSSCFHAQQASEKALKAFLIYCGFALERTHSVDELALRCIEQDSDFRSIAGDSNAVTGLYLDTRYATEDNGFFLIRYEIHQAERALEAARRIVALVESKIPPRPTE